MNSFLINKKGADKVISIYWFLILTLIAGGVFAMAYNFYGPPYDVRDIEANILANKVSDCVSYEGRINSELLFDNDFESHFLYKCNLNFDPYDEWDEIQYFLDVKFYNLSDKDNFLFEIKKGNLNLIPDCEIETAKGEEYERLVKCVEKRFYSVDSHSNQYLIKILTGVRKSEKNVKL